MKKIKFLVLALMALPFVFVSCDPDDGPSKPVSYVEDGFYVVGAATSIADLFATDADKALMAPGFNEVTKAVREGMYEKYVALTGGKEFQLVLKAGVKETSYGAALTLSETLSGDNEPAIQVYKGTLAENGAAMKVSTSGLYHIVLDVNLKLIVIAPVEWGVRGAMNSWGFTAFPAPSFNQTTMTYKLSNVTVEMSGGFKFAYGNGWKIELSGEEVKAETNIGNDGGENNDPITAKLTSGGKDIGIERAVWDIELTWTLAKGAVKEGFTAKLTKVQDLEPLPEYPENLYVIGSFATFINDEGKEVNWSWDSEYVITMTPVHSHPEAFWAITYFDADTEFKFAPVKDWNGDFGAVGAPTLANTVENVYDKKMGGDSNIKTAEAGYYLIYVDLKESKIFVGEPGVYLIGACSKDEKWDAGVAENKFAVTASGLTATTFGAGELRMYAASPFEGVDWWQMEFIIIDGKIVYRGNGGDQTRVNVAAGKIVTLDFKTGTGTIK